MTRAISNEPLDGDQSNIASSKPDQAAAICWRLSQQGEIEILLISSLGSGRWILPKGHLRKRELSFRAAQREALEEAGISGKIRKKPVGYFRYKKDGRIELTVAVHLLKVFSDNEIHPELGQRRKVWVAPHDATLLVDEPELKTILGSLAIQSALTSRDRQALFSSANPKPATPQNTAATAF